jgi:hypothetical protein
MAITNVKNISGGSGDVTASQYIRVIFALALSGLAELASLFFIQPLLPVLAVEYDVPSVRSVSFFPQKPPCLPLVCCSRVHFPIIMAVSA